MKNPHTMDYEIGTVFERGGKKYQTVRDKKGEGCTMCDLFNVGVYCTTVVCEGGRRADGVSVYFPEVQTD